MDADNLPKKSDQKPALARENRIYTKYGDAGYTMLVGRKKVPKDHPRVWVYGTLDEATSALGMARASTQNDDLCTLIIDLQGDLIGVMAELATVAGAIPPVKPVDDARVAKLERLIDRYEEERIATGQFVRPGGSMASAALDLARTIVRRAERLLVTLSGSEEVSPALLRYFNRLSDLLYVLARVDEQRAIKAQVIKALQAAQAAQSQPADEAKMILNFETSHKIIGAGIQRANQIGVPMVLAVCDPSGSLIAQVRMDRALQISVSLAPNKAYTAAAVRAATHQLSQLAQPGESLYGIEANLPNITLVGGGFPLFGGSELVGAVGVSGGTVEQDIDVALAMVKCFTGS